MGDSKAFIEHENDFYDGLKRFRKAMRMSWNDRLKKWLLLRDERFLLTIRITRGLKKICSLLNLWRLLFNETWNNPRERIRGLKNDVQYRVPRGAGSTNTDMQNKF